MTTDWLKVFSDAQAAVIQRAGGNVGQMCEACGARLGTFNIHKLEGVTTVSILLCEPCVIIRGKRRRPSPQGAPELGGPGHG